MAFASNGFSFTLLLAFVLLIALFTQAANGDVTPPRRHGMAIIKSAVSNQYFTTFVIAEPPVTFSLSIDLGNLYSWVACDANRYKSSTFHPVRCGSATCSAYRGFGCSNCPGKPRPSCTNNTCSGFAYTPWSNSIESSNIIEDDITLYTRRKGNFRVLQYSVPHFPFSCARKRPMKGLSVNSMGVLTLANVDMALHKVLSKTFRTPHKFALCLPSTNTILYKGFQGALYFGGGPYYMSKENKHDFSRSLVQTPLVVNPVSTAPISTQGEKSVEYFINVRSIEVGGTPLKFDSSLLSINKNGIGGTKLSTMAPYTVLHSTIYKPLVEAFTAKAKAMNIPRVAAVAPFRACYNARHISNSTSGPVVPRVDFLLDGKNARWTMYGPNLLANFFDIKYKDVLCLAFVDGGVKTTAAIVIGGKQMEDTILEIDLESNKVGVTSAPVRLGLSCSQFQSTLPTFE